MSFLENQTSVAARSAAHFALNTLQATGDIRKVALWLGHESIQILRYTFGWTLLRSAECLRPSTSDSETRLFSTRRQAHRFIERQIVMCRTITPLGLPP